MNAKLLTIEGMSCEHCAAAVKEALESIPGVIEAEVDLDNGFARASLDYEVADDLFNSAIDDAGYVLAEVANL